jgi:hypothetical protein
MKENKWISLLAYVTGLVNQELLLQNEYLAAENRILSTHLPTRLRLCDPERSTLAKIGEATRPQGPGPGRLCCQAGCHSGLVSKAYRPEIRWLQTPPLPRQAANRIFGTEGYCDLTEKSAFTNVRSGPRCSRMHEEQSMYIQRKSEGFQWVCPACDSVAEFCT